MADNIHRRATPSMGREEFLKCIDRVYRSTQHGIKALHKPLLLLLTLGRLYGKKDRLAPYQELEKPMKDLLARFSPHTADPRYPFWHLRNDRLSNGRLSNGRLWEVWVDKKLVEPDEANNPASRPPGVVYFRNPSLKGGFSKQVYQFLLKHPELVLEVSEQLLCRNFHKSCRSEIRAVVDLPQGGEKWVDDNLFCVSRFHGRVLRAYEWHCSVCDFDIRLNDVPFGLEAVHIKWRTSGGPDWVTNGLALCDTHRKPFVLGALGFRHADKENYEIIVSSHIQGDGDAAQMLRNMRGKRLRRPNSAKFSPSQKFVDWHNKTIFRHSVY